MPKLLMVDYYGMCNEQGQAIGHSVKVLEEYTELVEGAMEVSVAASPSIIKETDKHHFLEIYPLKYDIVLGGDNSFGKRIEDKIKLLVNLKQASQIKGYDFIWFYRTDFFLFVFLLLHFCSFHNAKKKIALVYQEDFGNRILNYIFKCAIKKFDMVIVTTDGSNLERKKIFKMPDYLYDEEKYNPFVSMPKQEKVVCVGTMNYFKKLEELVEAFNKNGYPLEIVGPFSEHIRAEKLKQAARENVTIEDRILTYSEYYDKIGEAKYSILPYDVNQYRGRTSGVLLESIFLDTIPIVPEGVFKEASEVGYEYKDFGEIETLVYMEGYEEEIERMRLFRENKFSQKMIQRNLLSVLEEGKI